VVLILVKKLRQRPILKISTFLHFKAFTAKTFLDFFKGFTVKNFEVFFNDGQKVTTTPNFDQNFSLLVSDIKHHLNLLLRERKRVVFLP
jgi:hypothetical protein